jgi:hypothetical protein
MSSEALVFILKVLLLVGLCLTVYKLLKTGLFRYYPWFTAYFAYRIPLTACLFFLSIRSNAYRYVWIASALLSCIFYVLTLRELYSLVLAKHRGLYTLGKWALYLAVAVSVTASVLSLPKFPAALPTLSKIGTYVGACDRGVMLSVAIFLIAMLFLLSQYVAVLSRNVVVHAGLFATYFFSSTMYSLLRVVFRFELPAVYDTALMAVSAGCVWSWFFLLSPAGEKTREVLPHVTVEHEGRILAHLDSMNDTLLRAGKK